MNARAQDLIRQMQELIAHSKRLKNEHDSVTEQYDALKEEYERLKKKNAGEDVIPAVNQYLWQPWLEAALVEPDLYLLPGKIAKAREAMAKRLGALRPKNSATARAEYRAIEDALNLLRLLENSVLSE